MNSKKLLMTLSVLATPFAVEAAVETNTAEASNTYTVNQNVKTYTNAANAAKSANAKSTYGQGTYHVYKQANGMINISKTPGKAGAWINPNENKVVATPKATTPAPAAKQQQKTVTQPAQKVTANQYSLNTSVRTYSNASSAATQTNARSTYAKGNYYVYKQVNGMINISRTQGKAGAWINPAENKVTAAPVQAAAPATKTAQTSKAAPAQQAKQYTLEADVNTYTNAGLASSKTNAKSKYTKGTYFVYKTANGMINISKTAGKAGAWINPSENKAVQAKVAADAKKEQATQPKQTTKPESKKVTQEQKPATTAASTAKEAPKFDANGLLVRQRSAKGQQVINHLLSIPGHRNGAAYHASSGVDKLIDELTTPEALWVIHRIEGAGFGQTGDGYAGIDTAKSHQVFVQNQLNRRFGGSVHALLKKWGTYSYGGY